jgi:adenylate cyclase
MPGQLSLEQLAARSRVPAERLREWRTWKLIGDPQSEGFAPEDLIRARLVRLFLRRGIDPQSIATWVASGEMDRHVALLAPSAVSTSHSLAEAAQRAGADPGLLRQFFEAAGFEEEELTDEDVEALRMCKTALEGGFPTEAMVEFVRVFTDTMRRVAGTQAHLFHVHVRSRLQSLGLTGTELTQAVWNASEKLLPLGELALLYFYRRALRDVVEETTVVELAEQAGLLEALPSPGQLDVTIGFVDLASFTPLTEAMGDFEMARVLDRFSAVVRHTVNQRDGHVVKQIGDAFMLVFSEARSAVACALDIEAQVAAEPQFPAVRSGVHSGEVLYREGDYIGTNVNLASRVATAADRHQVLVTGAVRTRSGTLEGVEFLPLGKRHLKGIAEEFELFEARRTGASTTEKAIDPVCGMELGPAEIGARLSLGSSERVFCSENCLRRFIAAPEKFESAGSA